MNDITIKAAASGRTAYQVVPDPDDPIILQIDGKLTRVLDISATGFSLPVEIVASGRRYPFSLDLPSANVPVAGYVDAMPDKKGEFIQCVFVNLTPEESDCIHQYVLKRQKEAIRSIRSSGSSSTGF
ncbi:MAG: PilZ domain-containing protein [Granulosicoccus sp.]|nr:PilZ domain-containing protein [Granulosicoccus sp.]